MCCAGPEMELMEDAERPRADLHKELQIGFKGGGQVILSVN